MKFNHLIDTFSDVLWKFFLADGVKPVFLKLLYKVEFFKTSLSILKLNFLGGNIVLFLHCLYTVINKLSYLNWDDADCAKIL
jgi:hypothetical protein